MKRKSLVSLLLVAALMMLTVMIPVSAYAADAPINTIYPGDVQPTDIYGHQFEEEILALYGYGALAGTVSEKGEFFPDAVCSESNFVRFLANMYPKVKSPTLTNPNSGISQKRATDLLQYYSEKLGHAVVWNGGDPNAVISRAVAASFIVNMLDCSPALVGLINNGSNSSYPVPSQTVFDDVSPDIYYATPVAWAVRMGITNGTSKTTFSPDDTCTVAQVLTFLYRANGSPALKSTDKCPYVMDSSHFAYAAICWANGKGLLSTGDTLDPNTTACTRAYLVQCLWVLAGKPKSTTSIKHFTDVSAKATYATAVSWALSRSITNGTSSSTFSPFETITRGQAVTFLYRTYATD